MHHHRRTMSAPWLLSHGHAMECTTESPWQAPWTHHEASASSVEAAWMHCGHTIMQPWTHYGRTTDEPSGYGSRRINGAYHQGSVHGAFMVHTTEAPCASMARSWDVPRCVHGSSTDAMEAPWNGHGIYDGASMDHPLTPWRLHGACRWHPRCVYHGRLNGASTVHATEAPWYIP